MNLTDEEKKICEDYSRGYDYGDYLCSKCPLAIPDMPQCKRTLTAEEWEEYSGGFD